MASSPPEAMLFRCDCGAIIWELEDIGGIMLWWFMRCDEVD